MTDISSIIFLYNLIEVSDLGRRAENLGAQNATSNGGDASRVGKKCSYYLVEFVSFLFIIPTRDASPPLVLAFGAHVVFAARFWQLKMPKFGVAFEADFERPSFQPTLAEFKNSTT
ncbi:hypothetical protein [Prevotellamassilia timonensis]|uniref:hypothetical protein n=1 Tax=Prevotellamassilia timonensis TaxID=1852370 RepID=UPI00307A31E2